MTDTVQIKNSVNPAKDEYPPVQDTDASIKEKEHAKPGSRLLVIDNYDSFTYNLVQMFIPFDLEIIVKRADKITVKQASALAPDYLLVSPGPKDPDHAGISKEAIRYFHDKIPILGVCLGMQCLNEVFGGVTKRAPVPVHGKTDMISHKGHGIFRGMPTPFAAARYHSLVIEPASSLKAAEPAPATTVKATCSAPFLKTADPAPLTDVTEADSHIETFEPDLPSITVTAWNSEGLIMGVELKGFPVFGVQFHPESFMTQKGEILIQNFLGWCPEKTVPVRSSKRFPQSLHS